MIIRPTNGIIGGPQGDSRWNVFLPPAPTGLSGVAGDGQVVLSWTTPTVIAQTPITGYVVQYLANGGADWESQATGSAVAEATVTGLVNNTEYMFRVAAVSAIGVGSYSGSVSMTPAQLVILSVSGSNQAVFNGLWAESGTYGILGLRYWTKDLDVYGTGYLYFRAGHPREGNFHPHWIFGNSLGSDPANGNFFYKANFAGVPDAEIPPIPYTGSHPNLPSWGGGWEQGTVNGVTFGNAGDLRVYVQ